MAEMQIDSAAASSVPQSEPLNETQVLNNAGGFVFKIDDFNRLRRFIVLGSDGNNYYVSRPEADLQSAECVLRLLTTGFGERVVEEVKRISHEGRAAKQSPGILVLAMCARLGDAATRRAALAALPAVCRTASALFEWIQRCKELGAAANVARKPGCDAAAAVDAAAVMAWAKQAEAQAAEIRKKKAAAAAAASRAMQRRTGRRRVVRSFRVPPVSALSMGAEQGKPGWGRAMRRAVALWYLEKAPAAVAYQVTKYSGRSGWSHADLLRLAHPDPEAHAAKRGKAAEAEAAAVAAAVQQIDLKSEAAEAEAEVAEATKESTTAVAAEADWVMVSGEDEDESATQMQGGLAAAVAEAEARAAEAAQVAAEAGGDAAAAAAAAVEAQRVADMKAIFDFLTHGSLPGQPRKVRSAKPKKTQEQGAAMEVDAPAEAATGAASEPPGTNDAASGSEQEGAADVSAPAAGITSGGEASATDAAAAADVTALATDAAEHAATVADPPAAATTGAAATAAATPPPPALSPVLQYLVDAHRLRKEICLPKPPPQLPAKRSAADVIDTLSELQQNPAESPAVKSLLEQAVALKKQEAEAREAEGAAEEAAKAAVVDTAVALIRRHRFSHEHIGDTNLLRAPEVWTAFLEVGMPMTAMVRNLGRMTQLGIMKRPDCLQRVVERLRDPRVISGARLHPMTLLNALCTYRAGAGGQGVARWEPEQGVLAALEGAFYLAFKNVEPTGKRYLAGLDVSGSMSSPCGGMSAVTCREAAAAVLMTLVKTEPWVRTLAFSNKLVPMELKSEDKLEQVVSRASAIPMGGTDCALPILHALERRIPVDVFVILTDNETWFGKVHPAEALRRYRRELELPAAQLVVLAFNASEFSIADPADGGMLDVAGLDAAVPRLVADFVRGRLAA